MKELKRRGFVYICPMIERGREIKTEIKAYPHNITTTGNLEFDWAKGMVGAAAVFVNKVDAIKYTKRLGGDPAHIHRMYFPGRGSDDKKD